jgi:photosystem II stability/assembly factor-like uncharacterized protein
MFAQPFLNVPLTIDFQNSTKMLQKKYLLYFTFFFATMLQAQSPLNMEHLKGMKARSIGPAAMSGRITAIDVDLSSGAIYAGAASGGVWRSISGGTSWEALFDKQETQSIGAIAVNQKNPAEIWVGTGEGNPRNSQNTGKGIYKSIDCGKTWKCMGLEATRTIHRIIIHRDNPNVVYAACLGSAFGATKERGIYQTTDGGKTWKQILYINDLTGCADMVVDPANPNKIIAAMWEYERKPWTFKSGGKGSGIYVTFDGGEHWERRSDKDGLPKGELGRCGLAISRSKPNIVYAIVEARENAIYRSTDGGAKFQRVGQNGDRPFYYAEIYVDPKNENRVWNIFSLVSKSEDGAKSFQTVLPYYGVHPDHHAFWIHPEQPNYVIEGNDGGLNISRDGGASWQFIQNLPLGQFYHVNVDNEIPYNLYGGLQDNGTWVGPSAVWKSGGIRNADWQEVLFGDGFDAMPRRDNVRYGFGMSQGGNVAYFDRKTGATEAIQPQHPNGVKLRYNWNAAMAQDPKRDCGVYYGSQFVHYSTDCGKTWTIISPDLTTNDTTKQKADSGGLTPDVTNAENHCTILAIAPSAVDASVIWASTDDGNLQLTQDGGKTWKNLNSLPPNCPKNAWIPQIEVSQRNAGECFVVVNNYRQNDFAPYLYHTKDFGKTWARLADASQIPTYVLSVVQDAVEPNLLFMGTDFGLYVSVDYGKKWTKWTVNDFPSVTVTDMKIHPRDGDLVIATFGRAYFILDDIRPLREMARTNSAVLNQNFKVFEPADAYLASFRSTDGERFQADAIFEGQNKSPIAILQVWNKPDKAAADKAAAEKEKKETEKPTEKATEGNNRRRNNDNANSKDEGRKVQMRIFNESGDTVKTMKMNLDTGLTRLYWSLDRKGVRTPSWDEATNEDSDPYGTRVLPGRYKVVLTYGDAKDSTYLNVKADPRNEVSLDDMKAKDAVRRDLDKMTETANKAWTQLRTAEKTIALVDAQMANVVDSVKSDLTKQGKALKDSISALQKQFMLPKDAKGINRSPDGLMDKIEKANYTIGSVIGKPAANALVTVSEARAKLTTIVEKINAFFEKDFAKYQANVEKVQYSLFKKVEVLRIE